MMKRSAFKLAVALTLTACGGGGGSSGSTVLPPANPPPSQIPLPDAPTVIAHRGVATVDLAVAISNKSGLPAFQFRGKIGVAPTIRVKPGDKIVVNLRNGLSGNGMANDMNLHFHGLSVSPRFPADDVLTMLAMPGETLHYVVRIPKDQQPGLYWYHPHVHGEVDYQVGLAGMSGAIVVEGLSQRDPSLARMKERIIVVRDVQNGPGSRTADRMRPMDEDHNTHPCGADPGIHLTVNNVVRPTITIAPGEQQFFRIVNATGHRHLVLQVDGQAMRVVAIDGYALDVYSGNPPAMNAARFVLAPAGRVEFIATGPAAGTGELRTLCYNSGMAGDPDPPEILADLRAPGGIEGQQEHQAPPAVPRAGERIHPIVLPTATTERIVRLTEDSNGFYINGKAFDENAPPMYTVKVGTVEAWTVLNLTEEVHDFHMHQAHFLVQAINGNAVSHPHWADTVVVPARIPGANGSFKPGTLKALIDFKSSAIRGTFLFHCHILDHEDGGMMAKIEAI